MKKLMVSVNCLSCGSCTIETDLLVTATNGKAVPKGNGIITDKVAEALIATIDGCPSKAISVINCGSTNQKGTHGLNELYSKLYKELYDFQCFRPDESEYAYPIDNFVGSSMLVSAYSQHQYEYIYSSDRKAEDAGFYEFRNVLYDRLRQKIQERLIAHKNYFLYKFCKYEETEENYFYRINCAIRHKLEEYVDELYELSDGRVQLPEDILNFEALPRWVMNTGGRVGAFEANFTDKILHNEYHWIYPASDYKFKINTVEMEDYRGKSKWAYDIEEAILELNKDVINAFRQEMPPSSIAKLLQEDANDFYIEVRKTLNDKIDQLRIAIERYTNEYPNDHEINMQVDGSQYVSKNGKVISPYKKSKLFTSKIHEKDIEGIKKLYDIICNELFDLDCPIDDINNEELCRNYIMNLDKLCSSAPNLRMRAKNPIEIIYPRKNKNNYTDWLIWKAFSSDDRYCSALDEDTIAMFGPGVGGRNAYTLVECNSLDLKGAEEFIHDCLNHRAKWESINPKNNFVFYCLLIAAVDVDAFNEKMNEIAEFFYFLQINNDYLKDWLYAVGEVIRKGVYINTDRFLTKEAKEYFEVKS